MRRWLVALILAVGCETTVAGRSAVEIDAEPGFDLAAASTFAWRPRSYADGMTRAENPEVEERIYRAVRDQLLVRGYEERFAGSADLEVSYRADVAVTWNVDPGSGRALPGVTAVGRPSETYRRGTLVLEILDPVSARVVWRGRTDAFATGPPPEGREVAIDDAVERLLVKFPARRGADGGAPSR